jgi:chromosome segregation ATPase
MDRSRHKAEIARLTRERDEARQALEAERAECERLRHDVSRQAAALSEANTECERLGREAALYALGRNCPEYRTEGQCPSCDRETELAVREVMGDGE